MKPPPFDYADPDTLEDALDLLADLGDDAAIIAGGQSLIPLLNLRLARPEVVVDLRRVTGLDRIDVDEQRLEVGAMVKAIELEEHPAARSVPGVADAIAHLAHSQIRARTTIGGSVAHADPAAELPALLIALDGWVTLRSRARGERVVPARDFFIGPLMTSRDADEILTAVTFPRHPGWIAIDEVAARPGDFALVGAVTGLAMNGGVVIEPRVALFGVAGTPIRVPEAEAVLEGVAPGSGVFAATAQAVRDHVSPIGDSHASAEYRRHLAAVLVERLLRRRHD